jgi:hypothetical protein
MRTFACEWRSRKDNSSLLNGSERFMHPDANTNTQLSVIVPYLKENNPFLYGFKNMHDLQIWFIPYELYKLSENGFYV